MFLSRIKLIKLPTFISRIDNNRKKLAKNKRYEKNKVHRSSAKTSLKSLKFQKPPPKLAVRDGFLIKF